VSGIESVDARGNEVNVTAVNGAATIGPVAVALDNAGITVRDLTLRTPTLDDVFLELTGTHIRPDEGVYQETEEVTL
jgi:ABC-2 type transport system ATP-binding protein